jgi:hypothetical protein
LDLQESLDDAGFFFLARMARKQVTEVEGVAGGQ